MAMDPRASEAALKYDFAVASIGKVRRVDAYVNSKTPINHICLKHHQVFPQSPSNILRGNGLRCCLQEARRIEGMKRRQKAAEKYDTELAGFGILKRLDNYVTALTPILHQCLVHGLIQPITPNNALKGKGLKCCQLASNDRHRENQILIAKENFMKLLQERKDVEMLEPYINSTTRIKFKCILHDQVHCIPPSYLTKKAGAAGFACCRDALAKMQANKRIEKASALYDQRIQKLQRVIRLEPYKGRQFPILHKCLVHGEEHLLPPGNAIRGDGLLCCNRGTGWDTFERILDQKPLKSRADGETEFYIYSVPNTTFWHKIGIAINAARRSRDKTSDGIYGELCALWIMSSRRNAILIETALLRDPCFVKPDQHLSHLSLKAGYSEIRGGNRELLLAHAQKLVDLLEDKPLEWANWALTNIPVLQQWEKSSLENHVVF